MLHLLWGSHVLPRLPDFEVSNFERWIVLRIVCGAHVSLPFLCLVSFVGPCVCCLVFRKGALMLFLKARRRIPKQMSPRD